MPKSIEDNFTDWESSTFGFGYGTGEPHILRDLKTFLAACPMTGGYNYTELESAVGPTVAWLFINILCGYRVDVFEYGTSPRYAWLTKRGKALKAFIDARSLEQLLELVCRDSNYSPCYPDACNCGPEGYQAGVKCDNPFWNKRN